MHVLCENKLKRKLKRRMKNILLFSEFINYM